MIGQEEFLKKYNIDSAKFAATGLTWEALTTIFNDYKSFKRQLEDTATYLFNSLMKVEHVHSVRYRIKDEEHLIDKIIRKKIESNDSDISLDNYKNKITDFIGLRAIHLYKDEWSNIHDYITNNWELLEQPVANYREGDLEEMTQVFKEKGCNLKKHKYGYRSVHYLVITQPAKIKYCAEIQVRTIFEEGWSEIDHKIRYPNDQNNKLLLDYLMLLNRLAGNADEMGSYIKFMKGSLAEREQEFQKQLTDKNNIIADLQDKVSKLGIAEDKLKEITEELEKLKSKQSYLQVYHPSEQQNNLSFYVPGSFGAGNLNTKDLLVSPSLVLSSFDNYNGLQGPKSSDSFFIRPKPTLNLGRSTQKPKDDEQNEPK